MLERPNMTVTRRGRLTTTLAELVRIDSVNPDLAPGAAGEAEVAEWIADRLRQTPGISVEFQDAGSGRPNVIAIAGQGSGRRLMLNGHTDVVGVAGMAAPFEPRVEGGRLYGRGACDMKDALAAMIVLLEDIAADPSFPGQVIATFVVDEEYASIGTQAICSAIDRWRPDAALVLEGTDLDVVIAHKGFVWAEIVTHGLAAHGSAFATGVDAIAHMGRVLVGLEAQSRELEARTPHPIVGPPSMHASLIRGGQELSSYPDRCVLGLERRTIPGETVEQVHNELQGILDRLAGDDPSFTADLTIGVTRDPFEVAADATIVSAVSSVVERARGRRPKLTGAAGWMDSALLSNAGVPVAIFGSSGDGAHAVEEWADLAVLEQFSELLAGVAYAFCAGF
jgi:acetylornithine deacetylase